MENLPKIPSPNQIVPIRDLNILKEPRGIIKPLQWILSIFAFATTCSVETESSFSIKCEGGTNSKNYSFKLDYPFIINMHAEIPLCSDSKTTESIYYSVKSSCEFYVFIGVMAFLYCLAALVIYIYFDEVYRKNTRLTIIDFVTTAVFALMWLISSSAWAQGVSDLKYYSDPEDALFQKLSCEKRCIKGPDANFSTLDVSIIFGFLNTFVWAGNLWFLYKETPWFKVQAAPPIDPGMPQETDPQRV
ncbi:synaptophysin isoform X1 [Octopus bimaculoides]|nr:synaptophysin isoform X1 [Octopus bimaculoides]|eukprot:XP_014767924.1 PREDICTED: synaptophysin-like isoform X1 [Octopus bimaculoides]